jgi:Na+:H+ antiporter, NhaA family
MRDRAPSDDAGRDDAGRARVLLGHLTLSEDTYVGALLRQETVGGLLLLVVTVVALVWANSPYDDAYATVRAAHFGPEALDLHLTVEEWTSDGLLTVFFFVAGLELKRELVVGSLREARTAALPVVAALCGMAVPALIYVAFTAGTDAAQGWATPTATDVAFCLAVLAIAGARIPSALRAFLLTLAVVDDMVAIVLIGVFYASGIDLVPLLLAVGPLAAYALTQRAGWTSSLLPLLLGLPAWALVHHSGIHPTVVGVTLGLLTRVHRRDDEQASPLERLEHAVRPFSTGIAVPAFVLFSVGITVSAAAVQDAAGDRVAIGIVCARLVGKTVGVFGGAYLVARVTAARLSPDLAWADLFGMAVLTGIGLTVPLLVSGVAFGPHTAADQHATAAILVSALAAAVAGAVLLRRRHHHYVRTADADGQ